MSTPLPKSLISAALGAFVAAFSLTAFADKNAPLFSDLPGLPTAAPVAVAKPSPALSPSTAPANVTTNVPSQAGQGTNSMDSLDDRYRLAIGDRLSFRIIEDEEDPKPLFVTDSGDLEVPYIGRFSAVNKSCKELANSLKSELEKEYYFHATVIIAVDAMTKSRGKVYLVGAVRTAGPQEIPSDEVFTLSKAILRAGSFSDFADKHNVRVTRRKGGANHQDQTYSVDVAAILEKGKAEADLVLEAGDFIYVSERTIRF